MKPERKRKMPFYRVGINEQLPSEECTIALPAILRMVADDIERDQLGLWKVH
jgi:hypothetical protein